MPLIERPNHKTNLKKHACNYVRCSSTPDFIIIKHLTALKLKKNFIYFYELSNKKKYV